MESKAFHEQMLASLSDPDWDIYADSACQYDSDWYIRNCYRLSHAKKKEAAEEARKATTSFCEGWLCRVSETVHNFAGHEPDQDVQDWIDGKFGKLKNHKSRINRDLNSDGVRAGIDAGSRVSLHHGVNGKPSGQHLLA